MTISATITDLETFCKSIQCIWNMHVNSKAAFHANMTLRHTNTDTEETNTTQKKLKSLSVLVKLP